MGCHADSRSVTFGHVRCANMRLIVRICISQRIVMESRSDWCVTDVIRESCRGQEIPSNSGDHSQEIQGTGSHCTDETGGNTGLFFQRFAVVYIPHNHDIAGR